MSYTAWSVVFGEQPTAAKWNQLGTNDAGFKDGTNIDNLAILTRHLADANVTSAKLAETFFRARRQDNTTNSNLTGLRIQYGWGYCTAPGSTTYSNTKTVTFPTPFTGVPIVFATGAGYIDGTNPVNLTDLSTWEKSSASVGSLTVNDCIIRCYAGGDTIASTRRMGFAWLAIGLG